VAWSVFDHVTLPVSDLAASVAFYGAALAPLGVEQSHLSETTAEFGALSLVRRPPRELLHIAFIAGTRDAVAAFHRAGLTSGGRDNGPPGIRTYAPDYYAAYLLDPDRQLVTLISGAGDPGLGSNGGSRGDGARVEHDH
jgi:catechol 2,3-dioxygenase-like lactoylglutathione lyase family enzyme